MSMIVTGHAFLGSLHKAGILPDNCRRAIIDADVHGAVKIYYETFADERVFELALDTLKETYTVNVSEAK
jgi:hypothetical protein